MTVQNKLLPRTKLTHSDDGPPIRRDAHHDEPVFDDEDYAQVGSPIFERLAIMQMSHTCYDRFMDYLTDHPPERGAVLAGPKEHDAVTHVLIDEDGEGTAVSFRFEHMLLNEKLKIFVAAGLDVKGIVHSHPRGCTWPTAGDLRYVAKCFEMDKEGTLDRFLLPIVCGFRLYPFIVFRDERPSVQIAQVVLF